MACRTDYERPGLGLYLSKEIVDVRGGRISITNVEGGGHVPLSLPLNEVGGTKR